MCMRMKMCTKLVLLVTYDNRIKHAFMITMWSKPKNYHLYNDRLYATVLNKKNATLIYISTIVPKK